MLGFKALFRFFILSYLLLNLCPVAYSRVTPTPHKNVATKGKELFGEFFYRQADPVAASSASYARGSKSQYPYILSFDTRTVARNADRTRKLRRRVRRVSLPSSRRLAAEKAAAMREVSRKLGTRRRKGKSISVRIPKGKPIVDERLRPLLKINTVAFRTCVKGSENNCLAVAEIADDVLNGRRAVIPAPLGKREATPAKYAELLKYGMPFDVRNVEQKVNLFLQEPGATGVLVTFGTEGNTHVTNAVNLSKVANIPDIQMIDLQQGIYTVFDDVDAGVFLPTNAASRRTVKAMRAEREATSVREELSRLIPSTQASRGG